MYLSPENLYHHRVAYCVYSIFLAYIFCSITLHVLGVKVLPAYTNNMEHRWNHDIPNKYFLDPRYNAPYAPSLTRHDSELSNGSSSSSGSYYSSYSARSHTEAPTYHEKLQSTGGHGDHNHHGDNYPSSPSSSARRKTSASTRRDSISSSS
jgi:hypothetical protein